MLQYFKNKEQWVKRATLFLVSQNISLFGSSVVGFSIIWYITLETSSGIWLMLSTICALVPQVIVSFWAGVWADRYNRKMLIMVSDGFIALSTLALAASFFFGYKNLELLLIASVIRSLGAGVQMPAVNALYPQLVPQEKLTRVQGVNQTLNSLLLLLSPAVGGLVLASFGIVWTFMVDVVTAVAAISVMAFIPVKNESCAQERASVFSELKQGISYTFRSPLLRGIVICIAVSFFLTTPAGILTPLMVERSFGSDIWRLTANEIVWTVGSLAGGLYISLRGEFRDKIRTMALCLVAFGITFALLGVAGNFWIYLVIMGISGFFMPLISTAQTVLIQENVETHMMGRVFSIVQIVSAGAMPTAILLFGPLADMVSIEIILIVTGILLVCVGIIYGITNRNVLNVKAEMKASE